MSAGEQLEESILAAMKSGGEAEGSAACLKRKVIACVYPQGWTLVCTQPRYGACRCSRSLSQARAATTMNSLIGQEKRGGQTGRKQSGPGFNQLLGRRQARRAKVCVCVP